MLRWWLVTCAVAFQSAAVNRRPLTSLRLTAGEAIDTLAASQAATVAKIRAAIPELAEKSDACWSNEPVAGSTASLLAMDAPGSPNVAWLSSLTVAGMLSSLTIYNGPLTDVPHLASRVLVNDGQLVVFLDWRPRVNAGYEMVRPDGTYPGPEELGREAFAYSGARADMEKFYGDLDLVLTGKGPASDIERITRGPYCVDLTLPLNDDNLNLVVTAKEQAADFWLKWHLDPSHTHRPGAPVNTQYVYDTKARQNMYSALLAVFSAYFPDDAPKLAAADSGPLDEAYVGGGS